MSNGTFFHQGTVTLFKSKFDVDLIRTRKVFKWKIAWPTWRAVLVIKKILVKYIVKQYVQCSIEKNYVLYYSVQVIIRRSTHLSMVYIYIHLCHEFRFKSACTIETGLSDFHKLVVTVLNKKHKRMPPKVIQCRD